MLLIIWKFFATPKTFPSRAKIIAVESYVGSTPNIYEYCNLIWGSLFILLHFSFFFEIKNNYLIIRTILRNL